MDQLFITNSKEPTKQNKALPLENTPLVYTAEHPTILIVIWRIAGIYCYKNSKASFLRCLAHSVTIIGVALFTIVVGVQTMTLEKVFSACTLLVVFFSALIGSISLFYNGHFHQLHSLPELNVDWKSRFRIAQRVQLVFIVSSVVILGGLSAVTTILHIKGTGSFLMFSITLGILLACFESTAILSAIFYSFMILRAQYRHFVVYLRQTPDSVEEKIDNVSNKHPIVASLVDDLSVSWSKFLVPVFLATLVIIVASVLGLLQAKNAAIPAGTYIVPFLIGTLFLFLMLFFAYLVTAASEQVLKQSMKLKLMVGSNQILLKKLHLLLVYLHIGQQSGLHGFRIAGVTITSGFLQSILSVAVSIITISFGKYFDNLSNNNQD